MASVGRETARAPVGGAEACSVCPEPPSSFQQPATASSSWGWAVGAVAEQDAACGPLAAADLRQLVFDLRRALPGDAIPLAHGFVSRQAGPQLAAGALGHAAPPIQQLGKIRFRLAGIPVELRGDVIQPALLHPFAAVGVLLKTVSALPRVSLPPSKEEALAQMPAGETPNRQPGARFMDRLAQLLDQLVHALAAEIVPAKGRQPSRACLCGVVEEFRWRGGSNRPGGCRPPGRPRRVSRAPATISSRTWGRPGSQIQVALAQAHKGRVLTGRVPLGQAGSGRPPANRGCSGSPGRG